MTSGRKTRSDKKPKPIKIRKLNADKTALELYKDMTPERRDRIDKCIELLGLQLNNKRISQYISENYNITTETVRHDITFAKELAYIVDVPMYASHAIKYIVGKVLEDPNESARDKLAACKLLLEAENRVQRIQSEVNHNITGSVDHRLTFHEANKIREVYGLPPRTEEEWNAKEGTIKVVAEIDDDVA